MVLKLNKVRYFEAGLLLAFFLLGLGGILNHAMWRDELNGWLIARDSLSLGDFWHNVRYEGHPLLWYLCLLALNQITSHPLAMQLFHLVLATLAISLFIFYSPFTRLQKLLFCLGYLPIYEYLLISRNYAIGLLFLFAFCWIFPRRKKDYLALSFILALMANTNAYALLISVCLAMALGYEYFFRRFLGFRSQASKLNMGLSIIIFAVGLGLSIIMLFPPADSLLQGGAEQWFWQWDGHRFNQALTRLWNSYILILVPGDSQPWAVGLFAILSTLILSFWLIFLVDRPVIFVFYLLATGVILLFTYLKFLGSPRHYGHLYLILISALWLKTYYQPMALTTKLSHRLPRLQAWVKKRASFCLMIILICQLLAGLVGYIRDLTLPYSASRAVAYYLQEQRLDHNFLVGSEDFAVSPISGYLGQKIYYPESQGLGSFVLFNRQRQGVSQAEILRQIQTLAKFPTVLILNHPLDTQSPGLEFQFLADFKHSFIGNEQYYLYQISPNVSIP
ncbi:hypothetical protein [Synechocystis sp. LKSZ1]|uniref:hypothetical protein n=1 Tax=Synechocystis sp. LKSZ1 TaxID=3144951 RepID=UPI00336BD468